MTDAYLTVRQVAAQLGVRYELIIAHIDNGRLQAINIGTKSRRTFRIQPEWLANFVEESKVKSNQADIGKPQRPEPIRASRWIRKLPQIPQR
jgi:excisionase family DNA binding protein